jgi:hypothetical protein
MGELRAHGESVRIRIKSKARLPAGFELARFRGGVSGLGLVRALLPRRSSTFLLLQEDDDVVAEVELRSPSVLLPHALQALAEKAAQSAAKLAANLSSNAGSDDVDIALLAPADAPQSAP